MLSKKLTYACNCNYRAYASNESIYAEMYLNFVKDLKEGSYLYLAVAAAKENDCVVSACADCIGKIVETLQSCQSIPKTLIVFATVFVIVISISGFCFLK